MTKLASLSVGAISLSVLVAGCGGKVVFDTSGEGGAGGAGTSVVGTSVVGTSVVGTSVVATSVGTGSGGCVSMCDAANPQGVPILEHRVVRSCGCQMMGPCAMACAGSPACAPMGPPPQGPCGACIDTMKFGDQCYDMAMFGPQCTNNPDCKALVACIVGCSGG